jgi:hypothetical protein
VDAVELPAWAGGSAHEFIRLNRAALESDHVSVSPTPVACSQPLFRRMLVATPLSQTRAHSSVACLLPLPR